MSQKPAAKMTVWAWNLSHLDSFLAFAFNSRNVILYFWLQVHFEHFFFKN
jgi:hypothetical protein